MKQYITVDTYNGKVLLRELVDGKNSSKKLEFEPTLYVECKKETDYKNFYQTKNVGPVEFENMFDMYNFVKESEGEELYGTSNMVTQFLNSTEFDEPVLSNVVYAILDIEVCSGWFDDDNKWHDGGFPKPSEAEWPITAITDYRSDDKKYHVFSTAKWDSSKSLLKYKDEIDYHYYESEEDLLEGYLKFFKKNYPHVITGWNSKNFDITYIVNRIKNVLGEDKVKLLSPWKMVESKKTKGFTGEFIDTYKIYGIQHLDYLDIYKKFLLKPREKYTLAYISSVELKDEHKLEFTGTHATLYYDDPQFFVDYNIQDVRCVVLFEKKFKFLNLTFMLGYYALQNFEDVLSPVKTWENLLYKIYMSKHIVPPYPTKDHPEKSAYAGAYVFEVDPGLKNCVVSYDFASLYPSIIRQHYIGPDVIIKDTKYNEMYSELVQILEDNKELELLEEVKGKCINEYYISHRHLPKCVSDFLKKHNVTMTTNVQFFDKSKKSWFVQSVTDLYKERKANKKEAFKHELAAEAISKVLKSRGVNI